MKDQPQLDDEAREERLSLAFDKVEETISQLERELAEMLAELVTKH